MSSIDDGVQAAEYLISRGYSGVRPGPWDPKTAVSFKGGTGDGSWEREVADSNSWDPAGKNVCCYKWEEENPDAKYCGMCATGINDQKTYVREKPEENPINPGDAEKKSLELIV